MISGIYLLRFSNNAVYVGQSKDIQRRFTSHCNKLNKNTHVNSKLSSAYAKYGLPSLEIILECSPKELDIYEKEAVEIFNSIDTGLNIAPAGGIFPTLLGETNGFSKYSDADILLAAEYLSDNLDQPLKVSSTILGIPYSTVKNIANGTSHKWLSNKLPEKYAKLLAHKGKRTINSSNNKGLVYKVLSPNNITYNVTNISEFARQYNLNAGALGEVLRGNVRQHKGWTSPSN